MLEHQAEKIVMAELEQMNKSLTDACLQEHQRHQTERQQRDAEALKM